MRSITVKRKGLAITALAIVLVIATNCAAGEPLAAGVHKDLVYATRGDLELKADVNVPKGEGPFPAVLLVHGGSWRSGNKQQLGFVSGRLARNGYTVVAINYRLAPDHKFPAQIEDCKSAVVWMRNNAERFQIDASRIGAWGYSAGAHLVTLLGCSDPSHELEGPDASSAVDVSTRVRAVVAGGTPCDFRNLPEDSQSDRLAYWLGGTRAEVAEQYDRASPVRYVSSDDPPIFFYHGDADELVPLSSPTAMKNRLQEVGVVAELHVIPEAKHIGAALNGEANKRGLEFLDRHLKPSKTKPSQPAGGR